MTPTPPRRSLAEAWRLARAGTSDALRARAPGVAGGKRRGAALLLALTVIVVVGALTTQFVYHTRTQIWMSGNFAASTKAYFHARSATQIALLAVNAKKTFPQVQQYLSLMGKGAAERLEIWQRACEFVQIFATGRAEFFGFTLLDFSEEEAVGAESKREDVPAFSCEVSSEDARVNLNRAATEAPTQGQLGALGGGQPGGGQPGASGGQRVSQAQQMQQQRLAQQLFVQLGGVLRPMVDSGEFGSEDEIVELILNIIDWTDADDMRSDIDADGNFTASAGAEGGDYGRHGYEAKNAKMDTVGEVQLVEGMTSDVYCRLRDKLTVFATDKVNVNDADVAILKGILCQSITDDILRAELCWAPGPTGLTSPMDDALIALENCRRLKKQVYSTPFTSMATFNRFFQQFPAAMGTGIPLPINMSIVGQQLGVRTKMVRIEAEGQFGDTKRKMVTIVDTSTGAIVHYHYE